MTPSHGRNVSPARKQDGFVRVDDGACDLRAHKDDTFSGDNGGSLPGHANRLWRKQGGVSRRQPESLCCLYLLLHFAIRLHNQHLQHDLQKAPHLADVGCTYFMPSLLPLPYLSILAAAMLPILPWSEKMLCTLVNAMLMVALTCHSCMRASLRASSGLGSCLDGILSF